MKTSWGENKIVLVDLEFIFDADRTNAERETRKFFRSRCRMTDYFALYHGTTYRHNIMMDGLLPTCASRKKSLQSSHGYVYLSIYPDMAKFFGKMAYPQDEIKVYEVVIPLRMMLPDVDQLNNKKYWGNNKDIGTDLACSIVYGSGCRVKGAISPNLIEGIIEP